MPTLCFAFAAGEFLDEELFYQPEWVCDGWYVHNIHSTHPWEWWMLK
jgi:hypothetical protein